MKVLLVVLFLVGPSWANTIATKIIDIDGTQDQMQFELDTIYGEGTEWRDVEVPSTCHRTETRTVPRTCQREETYTVPQTCQREETYNIPGTCYRDENYTTPGTCYRTENHNVEATCYRVETRQHCQVVRPARCVERCPFGICRQVCYPAKTRCNNVATRVPYSCIQTTPRTVEYSCDQTATRRVPYECNTTGTRQVEYECNTTATRQVSYSCPQTETHEVPYECTTTERQEVASKNIKAHHIFYLQLNLGNYQDLSEKVELQAKGSEVSVKQIDAKKYDLEILPISSRDENFNDGKIFHHDVIIDILPKENL